MSKITRRSQIPSATELCEWQLKMILLYMGIGNKELANAIGVAETHISSVIKGKTYYPRVVNYLNRVVLRKYSKKVRRKFPTVNPFEFIPLI